MKPKDYKNTSLGLVLLRNSFYRDSYKRALVAVIFLIALNLCLLGSLVWYVLKPNSPKYFPATPSGRLIKIYPLSAAVLSDSDLQQWAANSIRKVFALNFVDWQSQLQASRGMFTQAGWNWFLDSLQASNNLSMLRSAKMTSSVEITLPPKIERVMIIGGRYVWKVGMSITLNFISSTRSLELPMRVEMAIVRAPVKDWPDRVAINNIIMTQIGGR